VWRWNPNTSTVEFIQHPDVPVPTGSLWLVYYPSDPVVTNLHAIHGETPYLIHLGGTENVTWTVTGEPSIPHIDWKSNSFNFVGFHLDPNQGPLFGDFFSSSLAHDPNTAYVLNNITGNWEQVTDPATTAMLRGEGFWIYCKGSSQFTGPLSLQLEQSTGLHYGKALPEQNVVLRNSSAADKNVSLSVPASPLRDSFYYWVFDPNNEVAGWTPFPAPFEVAIPAAGSQRLRLGVKRAGLEADTAYEQNMTVTDSEGVKILLPVSVSGISYSGLWVGDATITKVSEPAKPVDPNKPDPIDPNAPTKTGSELSFRLIVHADPNGKVRLLSQVIQMWQKGTWKSDPNDPGKFIVDKPGHFVLLVDDELIPNYEGSAMRDGQLVGRRISSPAFPPLSADEGLMAEPLDPSDPNNSVSVTITLDRADPVNPFVHRYHPYHSPPDPNRPPPEEQMFTIERVITMEFADEDAEGRPITGVPSLSWGSSEIGGIYEEQITGLHRKPLRIAGTFVLHKVSDVETLSP
jgi:hypothetical protein